MAKYQDNMTFGKFGLSNIWCTYHQQISKSCGLLIQASKLCENSSCVSCLIIRTLPIHHPKKKVLKLPPPTEINNKHEYKVKDFLNSRLSNQQLQYVVH